MKTPNDIKSWVDMLLSRRPNTEDRNYLEAIKCYMDKVERPQGEWEKPFLHSDGRWYHKCTNCHVCSEVSILQDKYCNFCVNCGADMRGGRE